MKKTLTELGRILVAAFGLEAVRDGYNVDPSDLAEVGRQGLLWHDINPDGSLN